MKTTEIEQENSENTRTNNITEIDLIQLLREERDSDLENAVKNK